jgi:hypothetical protein
MLDCVTVWVGVYTITLQDTCVSLNEKDPVACTVKWLIRQGLGMVALQGFGGVNPMGVPTMCIWTST